VLTRLANKVNLRNIHTLRYQLHVLTTLFITVHSSSDVNVRHSPSSSSAWTIGGSRRTTLDKGAPDSSATASLASEAADIDRSRRRPPTFCSRVVVRQAQPLRRSWEQLVQRREVFPPSGGLDCRRHSRSRAQVTRWTSHCRQADIGRR